jgi:hypothetical protein
MSSTVPQSTTNSVPNSATTIITRRLSVGELSQRILAMATTGVYRASVLEALQPLASQKQIARAIAHAKRFGLHSVASLRDAELGTYYQVDLVKYAAHQHLLTSAAHLGEDAELVDRVTQANQAVQSMLAIARSLGGLLVIATIVAWANGWQQLSVILCSSAASALGVWAMQKSWLPKA